jgi:GH15 family glucan-1,4-alpha-glucosidase
VGFLPPGDPAYSRTVKAIEHELMQDGFPASLSEEPRSEQADGLPPGEGVFPP